MEAIGGLYVFIGVVVAAAVLVGVTGAVICARCLDYGTPAPRPEGPQWPEMGQTPVTGVRRQPSLASFGSFSSFVVAISLRRGGSQQQLSGSVNSTSSRTKARSQFTDEDEETGSSFHMRVRKARGKGSGRGAKPPKNLPPPPSPPRVAEAIDSEDPRDSMQSKENFELGAMYPQQSDALVNTEPFISKQVRQSLRDNMSRTRPDAYEALPVLAEEKDPLSSAAAMPRSPLSEKRWRKGDKGEEEDDALDRVKAAYAGVPEEKMKARQRDSGDWPGLDRPGLDRPESRLENVTPLQMVRARSASTLGDGSDQGENRDGTLRGRVTTEDAIASSPKRSAADDPQMIALSRSRQNSGKAASEPSFREDSKVPSELGSSNRSRSQRSDNSGPDRDAGPNRRSLLNRISGIFGYRPSATSLNVLAGGSSDDNLASPRESVSNMKRTESNSTVPIRNQKKGPPVEQSPSSTKAVATKTAVPEISQERKTDVDRSDPLHPDNQPGSTRRLHTRSQKKEKYAEQPFTDAELVRQFAMKARDGRGTPADLRRGVSAPTNLERGDLRSSKPRQRSESRSSRPPLSDRRAHEGYGLDPPSKYSVHRHSEGAANQQTETTKNQVRLHRAARNELTARPSMEAENTQAEPLEVDLTSQVSSLTMDSALASDSSDEETAESSLSFTKKASSSTYALRNRISTDLSGFPV